MSSRVSFFVKGPSPFAHLKSLLLNNGLLKSSFGLERAIAGERRLGQNHTLVQLDTEIMRQMQLKQGIPFTGIQGSESVAFTPQSALVVAKDQEKLSRAEVDALKAALKIIRRSLKGLEISFQQVSAKELQLEHLKGQDLIIPVGGDGTFIGASHLAGAGLPLIGINPEPGINGSWGHYLPLTAKQLEDAIKLIAKGDYQLALISRLAARLRHREADALLKPALNELYIGEEEFRHASRYSLSVGGLEEAMIDSGLLVSTGAGSAANSWTYNADGLSFSPLSSLVQFRALIAPPHLKNGGERELLHGFAEELQVTSRLRHAGLISVDSSVNWPFPQNTILTVRADAPSLCFPVFPTLAQPCEIKRPESVIEVSAPKESHGFTPAQLAEIDSLNICRSVPAKSKKAILLLQVDRELKKLRLMTVLKSGNRPLEAKDVSIEAVMPNPTLLYPTAEISQLPATIRDIIFGLYTYGLRITEFNGTFIEHEAAIDSNVWAPSIDTIAFIKAMLDHALFSDQVKTAAEVGVGAGMIGKAIAQNCANLTQLTITDVELNAIKCAWRNLELTMAGKKIIPMNEKGIKPLGKNDLIVINPPYLPEKEVSGEVDQYRGLGLIHEILRDGKAHLTPGGSVVINYSSCAGKEFDQWVAECGWHKKELLTIKVPLKIVRVSKDPEWLEFMLEHGGLEIRDEVETGYRYWHTLNIVKLTPA